MLLLALAACASADSVVPRPLPPRVTAKEILVRTSSFLFRTGADVDPTWPEKAEETRAALGHALPELLEEEETTVDVLARELGVTWPREPLDFDVLLRPDATEPCAAAVPRLLYVGGGEGRVFFACVLERAFARLRDGSTMWRGMVAERKDAAEVAPLYACLTSYAVAAVMVARAANKREARAIEERIGDACHGATLDWVAREWVKRVKEDESAEAFGARAAREVGAAR